MSQTRGGDRRLGFLFNRGEVSACAMENGTRACVRSRVGPKGDSVETAPVPPVEREDTKKEMQRMLGIQPPWL